MSILSRIIQRRLQLPPPITRDLRVHRDLRTPMPDGTVLLADRWEPRDGERGLPVALIRTPYGRRGPFGAILARPLAERGFQVLIQSVRGGFGSGGTLDPMRQERADGLATLDWVIGQPWFGDAIVLYGLSYLGYVQWAMAGDLPPAVKAMIPQVTESALTLEFLRADGLSLETPFGWGALVGTQERPLAMLRQFAQARRTARALWTLPLGDADTAAIGTRSPYIQDVLAHDAASPRWADLDHRERVAQVGIPVSSIGGWYDIFLPGQLRDFRALQQGGRPARLTVGPWTHTEMTGVPVREAVEFGLAYARGEQPPPRPPVRLYVTGEEEWRDFASWPPDGYAPQRWHLQPDGGLAVHAPTPSPPDRYRYDPADPTPAVGGVRLVADAGRVDNTALEARPDVLVYTGAVLDEDLEIVGEVGAEIWFESSAEFADVFVRLCDVDPQGRSVNVCDGLTSVSGAGTAGRVEVRLWPAAHRFQRGHRIRVQVSSGAFPRYARNLGTGEPHPVATRMVAADQAVHHDPQRPSSVVLPVRAGRASG
ncbi:CocE/NonD family hydrolase [Actinoplanes sichuanensis]|uniref:CocE/NonD family hydrolase n=1 Tax=Actinoplanes sichuanensis TaxID=512349 RepID=A0ABW4A443_9ACTN|nr:CocE/NonD family hydrolase [Actinoplanes sichuanensis]BEL03209.1 CocE/NonD family hydrolase [Actinoplanes sichuanensis]